MTIKENRKLGISKKSGSFRLEENNEEASTSESIEDLAQTMVDDYTDIAKQILDAKRLNEDLRTSWELIEICDSITPRDLRNFLNALEEIYLTEYSQIMTESD